MMTSYGEMQHVIVPSATLLEPGITITGVWHRYGTRVALADVSLQVGQGEIFGLLGPNGGGKTTLFHLLATLMPLMEGQVEVLGYDLRRSARAIRPHLGVVFQHPSLDRKLTVYENLRHHGHLYGMSGGLLRERIQFVVQRVGLENRGNDLVETLSGGLQRRLELAKAFLHGPSVLLLDEPSTGLDPGARLDLPDDARGMGQVPFRRAGRASLERAHQREHQGESDGEQQYEKADWPHENR